MRQILLGILLVLFPTAQRSPVEPIVRIGLTQNAASVTVRSAQAFTVAGRSRRTATFAAVLAVDPTAKGPVAAADLQYRITARLDDGTTEVMPADGRVRIDPPAAPLEIEARAYRGALEIFGNSRRTLTVVNELPLDFRAEAGVIPMLVYRVNFANPAADHYSRVALWQVRKTKAELDTAFRSLAIGAFSDMRVIQRGLSERLVSTEIIGTTGRTIVPALRLRTLLSLRDSLFSYDIERNASGTVVGATFFGRGWGHGVGMCQVGAYGMALAGARYEEILKKYYTGIELQKVY